jgi:hypothetical protein
MGVAPEMTVGKTQGLGLATRSDAGELSDESPVENVCKEWDGSTLDFLGESLISAGEQAWGIGQAIWAKAEQVAANPGVVGQDIQHTLNTTANTPHEHVDLFTESLPLGTYEGGTYTPSHAGHDLIAGVALFGSAVAGKAVIGMRGGKVEPTAPTGGKVVERAPSAALVPVVASAIEAWKPVIGQLLADWHGAVGLNSLANVMRSLPKVTLETKAIVKPGSQLAHDLSLPLQKLNLPTNTFRMDETRLLLTQTAKGSGFGSVYDQSGTRLASFWYGEGEVHVTNYW